MLNATLKPHREYLRANAAGQKVFVMLKLRPTTEAASVRPRVHIAVVVDTSGSMREPAPGAPIRVVPSVPFSEDGKTYAATYQGTSKLDTAIEAARHLVDSPQLRPDDLVSIIHFDDESAVFASGEVGTGRQRLVDGISALSQRSGGTRMGRGLSVAEALFRDSPAPSRKVLLLTDGQTVDEAECRRACAALAEAHVPVISLGVGEEYNHELLEELCNITQGRPHDLRQMYQQLDAVFDEHVGGAIRQVVSNVEMTFSKVPGVMMTAATKSYPNLAAIDLKRDPIALGNLEAGDDTVFVFELDVPARPRSRARLAQVGITYRVPAQNYRGELPPKDLVLEFTEDEGLAAQVDAEVMSQVQQRNVDQLVKQATIMAGKNPEQAAKTLQLARSMTQKLGNTGMTIALGNAEHELRTSGTISAGTVKTIRVGARTHTMKVSGGPDTDLAGLPSEDEIRRLSGT